ncbi:MAG: hypothetical protein HOB82_00460 [Alphaproteobacteria bacterium]|nr:hypothetical protein [Alphaproteobacteria bacterium]
MRARRHEHSSVRTRARTEFGAAMADLSDREQTIIRERRLSETGKTLETLGGELGISKERVRQIEQEAMGKLRVSISQLAGPDAIAHRGKA